MEFIECEGLIFCLCSKIISLLWWKVNRLSDER